MCAFEAVPPPIDEPCVFADIERAAALNGQYISPPHGFIDGDEDEERLAPWLREAAQTRDPLEILTRAAVSFFWARNPFDLNQSSVEAATALADLAVTGRTAYAEFRRLLPDESQLIEHVRQKVQLSPLATTENIAPCVAAALDRAYRVAAVLRTPKRDPDARASLGWIAVAGEDDPPHRPVNVATTRYPQYDVPVACRGITIETRYMLASNSPSPADVPPPDPPPGGRALPEEPPAAIATQDEIILYVHGHSSDLEEADDLAPQLLDAGAAHGRSFCVIAFDLPSCGYAQMIDHGQVAPSDRTTFDRGTKVAGVPTLEFIEDFICAFVDTLDQSLHIKNRLVAVIGGSLGGNMGLRLGQRDLNADPWLRNIAAWSPASVWESWGMSGDPLDPADFDALKSDGCRISRDRMDEPEVPERRHQYFAQVYDGEHGIHAIAQAPYWYRDDPPWIPCKQIYMDLSRRGRREVYNALFRRWHWRVAYEQLIFSHRDPTIAGGPPRYLAVRANMLLGAGEKDGGLTDIFKNTRELAGLMTNARITPLFLEDTGHSIHNERPRALAGAICDFLPPWDEQPHWRWCNKCGGLYFAGYEGTRNQHCPAGGAHDSTGSADYVLVKDTPMYPGQPGWRWCSKCEGLYFADYEGTRNATCPAGEAHDDGGQSGHYALLMNATIARADGRYQPGWNWCSNCEGLFYNGPDATASLCPKTNGKHDPSGSSDYSLKQS